MPIEDAAKMQGNAGADQIAPECAQPRKRPFLVGTDKLAVSGHILKDLGVGSIGHRRKLLEAIALLRDAADAKGTAASAAVTEMGGQVAAKPERTGL